MRGAVLNPFMGNWISAPPLATYDIGFWQGFTLPEIMFWYWRVNEIDVEWSFTRASDGAVNSGSFRIDKTDQTGASLPTEVAVSGAEIPQYNDMTAGGNSSTAGFFPARVTYDAGSGLWLTYFGPQLNTPGGPTIFKTPQATGGEAGAFSIEGQDLVLGQFYQRTGALYSTDPDVSGNLTITPASFYEWRDPDGNALYDALTGALI